ncbi:MAG: hypothetical protein KDC98_12290, partial [Planctomycetes bacterium]|nr:hypothetical protein [Planctomycetota bacterium]
LATVPGSNAVHSMRISAGASRAGQYYLTLLGSSGVRAGTSFPPETLPLHVDVWTIIAAGAPTPPFFPGFQGLLDADGEATATIDLTSIPFPPVFLGQRWTCAVLGIDSGGYWGGGPAEFEIVP